MLSIGKLAKGQEGYYLDAVARGAEDYYLEGEAPGRLLGAGPALLGLASEVDSDALAAVLDGRDPTTGTPLRSSKGGRVPGFDLTFRAPKSVSVVFGLAEADISAVVAEAHISPLMPHSATWSGTQRGPGAGTEASNRSEGTGSSQPPSATGPVAPAIRTSTLMCSSPTPFEAPTAGGRRSTPATSTGTRRQPVTCTKPTCDRS